MKENRQNLNFLLMLIAVLMGTLISKAHAQVNVNLDDPNLYYDGILYPIVTPNLVTFNRHTPAAYADPSSGIVYAPCNLTRATQSGVRIRFKTASPTIKLTFAAQTSPAGYFYNSSSTPPSDGFTVSVNGQVIQTFTNTLSFTINNPTPSISTEFEVNLPTLWSVVFTGMQLENTYSLDNPGANVKLRYAAFGTSISMGTGQNNTTQTYPYQLAQAKNWNLFNFAVAGSSLGWQLAYDIKGKLFDIISIEQGFNDWASQYLTTTLADEMTLYGQFVDSLRLFQPTAKIYCIAPTATTYNNPTPRYALDDFRAGIGNLVAARVAAGDKNIFYINGASITDGTMTVDGIHFSIPGAAKFADSLISLMVPAIGNHKGYIPADDAFLQYSGRIDFSNPKRPSFSYPGVSIKANFQGTSLTAIIKDYGLGGATTTNYYNVLIDGASPIVLAVNNTDTLYSIATNLSDTVHTLEIVKRTEASVGKSEFRGLVLATGKALVSPKDKPALKYEFIGDSYTCGYGDEVSIPQSGNPNTGFHSVNENNYNAWGAIATRTLNAQYVCTAVSGRGLYRNNTGSTVGVVPSIYDETLADQSSPTWDHNNYIPNVVVIHLGTNDFFPVASGNAIDSTAFVNAYINFVNKLRGYYPSACLICAVPNGLSDYYPVGKYNLTRAKNFIKAVVDYVNAQGDKKVYNFVMTQQGTQGEPYGEDYHPSLQTQQIMANDLVTFVNNLTDCSAGGTTEKTPTIQFSNLIKTQGDTPFLLNAVSNSTGAMTYSIVSGNAAIVTPSGQVTLTGIGTVLIKVSQAAATGYAAGSATATLTILSQTMSDTLAMTTNLALSNDGSWSTQTDALGSKVNSFTQAGPVDVSFTQTAMTGVNWPWVVLTKTVGIDLSEMVYIKLTYTSNLPLQMSLPQPPLSATGESYTTSLDASATPKTVWIPISAFAQPGWATNKLPLDLSKVSAINLIPVISTSGGNSQIEVQSLILYKSSLVTGIYSMEETTEKLSVYPNPAEENIYINASENGVVKMMNGMGNVVYEGQYEVKQPIPVSDLPKGIYYLQITNSKETSNLKVIIE